jgi:soluble lytic murein transglycosylase-like protein
MSKAPAVGSGISVIHPMNSQWLDSFVLALLILGTAALAPLARAAFVCRDQAGNIYRLPAPLDGSDALSCSIAPEAGPTSKPAPHQVMRPLDLHAQWPRMLAAAMHVQQQADQPRPSLARRALAPKREHEDFDAVIREAAARYEHDVNLLRAMVYVESGFDAQAVSRKGAIGLMQVLPTTARDMGLAQPSHELFDPARNVDAGARHLRRLMNTFEGQPELAVAAYNAGQGAVAKHGNTVPPYPETRAYVEKVRARYMQLRGRRGSAQGPVSAPASRIP